jgi:hypothetical protein
MPIQLATLQLATLYAAPAPAILFGKKIKKKMNKSLIIVFMDAVTNVNRKSFKKVFRKNGVI